jgi:hypothetical protein
MNKKSHAQQVEAAAQYAATLEKVCGDMLACVANRARAQQKAQADMLASGRHVTHANHNAQFLTR